MIVQSQPPVANANSYVALADFKSYHTARGNSYTATDAQIEQSLIKATDYIDAAYSFLGTKTDPNQTTEFPRNSQPIPLAILKATKELAFKALSINLEPQNTAGGAIVEKTEKLGAIEETVKYSEGVVLKSTDRFFIADKILTNSGLLSATIEEESAITSTRAIRS